MKKTLLFAATALAMLASCSQSDDLNNAPVVAETNQAVEFSTYVGKTPVTRAGRAGSITTDNLKTGTHKDDGFGVFAYYTGTDKYNSNTVYTTEKTDGTSGQSSKKANFMYNQQVKWNGSATESASKWEYSPIKYWPNDIAEDNNVDDQDAKGSETGGKLSFFAYAPYVDAAISETTKGIVAINGETTLAGGNVKSQDPILSYIVAPAGNEVVDLLWGTKGSTSTDVLNNAQNGATYNGSGTNFEKSILPNYSVNADLIKQKTEGTVDFAFKHALSKVGGSELYSTLSGGENHGLMIKLETDELAGGGKTGGPFDNTETKVTVKEIKIEARAKYDEDASSSLDDDEYMKSLRGDFNLATGQWGIYTTTNFTTKGNGEAVTTHIINTGGTGTNVAGALNTTIAEPTETLEKNATAWNGLVEGVLTTPKNVYASEASPLVFIPGTTPELTITVDYLVRTKDTNLADEYSEVEQKIKKVVTFASPVALNKQYNILIHLGLTRVKFTATVSDWVVDGDTNGNGTIDGGEAVNKQDVNLPLNVQ